MSDKPSNTPFLDQILAHMAKGASEQIGEISRTREHYIQPVHVLPPEEQEDADRIRAIFRESVNKAKPAHMPATTTARYQTKARCHVCEAENTLGTLSPTKECAECLENGYDSNLQGEDLMSIAARIKNQVVLSSRVKTGDGSHMSQICNQVAHSVKGMYRAIRSCSDLSPSDMVTLMTEIRKLEAMPARFAQGLGGK